MKKLIVCVGIVIVALGIVFLLASRDLNEVGKASLSGIFLENMPDGEYRGTYSQGRWTNTVVVTVKDYKIASIVVEEDVLAGKIINCFDEVVQRVITAQDTRIDVASGATVTSKAYLKAIENALTR